MPNTSKSSRKASTGAARPEFTDVFAGLYRDSFANVAELQKKSLDVVAEQTAEWIAATKKGFGYFPVAAPEFLFDVAKQAVQTCVETQKSAIDSVVEQAQDVTKIASRRAAVYAKVAEGAAAAFQVTVARTVRVQKKGLEFASAQNKAICEAARKQVGGPATVIVDSFERCANALMEAQKSLLDASTQPFAVTTEA